MPSRRPKATAKLQGAFIISLPQYPHGKCGLSMVILVKTRKTFSILWREFRQFGFKFTAGQCGAFCQFSFKFIAGQSLKVSDMPLHSAR